MAYITVQLQVSDYIQLPDYTVWLQLCRFIKSIIQQSPIITEKIVIVVIDNNRLLSLSRENIYCRSVLIIT